MALRDQPYLPLYVQDYLTDEKLSECSAATQGIYMKIMCLMHKSEEYGKILLKQKYKQKLSKNESKVDGLAYQLVKHLPFSKEEIAYAINELINEEVCYLENDSLCQKRMIRDNEISLKRAQAGEKGGKKGSRKDGFASAKHKANDEANSKAKLEANNKANSEYENENENEIDNVIEYLNKKAGKNFKKKTQASRKYINARLNEGFKEEDFKKVIDKKCSEWKDDPQMDQYLRPETLFRPSKFESYLNQKNSSEKKPDNSPIYKKIKFDE